jgi:hypothetical protein
MTCTTHRFSIDCACAGEVRDPNLAAIKLVDVSPRWHHLLCWRSAGAATRPDLADLSDGAAHYSPHEVTLTHVPPGETCFIPAQAQHRQSLTPCGIGGGGRHRAYQVRLMAVTDEVAAAPGAARTAGHAASSLPSKFHSSVAVRVASYPVCFAALCGSHASSHGPEACGQLPVTSPGAVGG